MTLYGRFGATALLSFGVMFWAQPGWSQANSLMASGSNGSANNSANSAKAAAPIAPVRSFSTSVRDGILTVDGMVGKAQMNYDVHQAFLYFTIPGVGTAIVAQTHFMNSAEQKNGFHGNMLTFNANGHTVELTSAGPLVGEKNASAWVAIDPLYGANMFPQMGFGDTTQRPYVWPGSKTVKTDTSALVKAPPLPASLRPKPEVASSYTVVVPASQPKQ